MAIRPKNLKKTFGLGDGDMAQAFSHPDGGNFALSYLRVHFIGDSGAATLTVSVDSDEGVRYDAELFRLSDAGPSTLGKDVNFRIARGELEHWTFDEKDRVSLAWLDPDAGDATQWGIEIGLVQYDPVV